MRRTHLRKHEDILKRQLIHIGAFNLSLVLRQMLGAGTPREWKNRGSMLLLFVYFLLTRRWARNQFCRGRNAVSRTKSSEGLRSRTSRCRCSQLASCATG